MSTTQMSDWAAIADSEEWRGLLVGNGASMAIWPKFSYRSLFDEAKSSRVDRPLTSEDLALFTALDSTRNFEHVLDALTTGMTVTEALGYDAAFMEQRYNSIQQALFDAVHSVHIPWSDMGAEALRHIRSALTEHDTVYSTNYDLLIYWAIMSEPRVPKVVDFLWGEENRFDAADTDLWNGCTQVLYLHGGLHLYRHAAGGTAKNVAHSGRNLLDLFGELLENGHTPLLVSEGTSADKLLTIRGSDYLTYCYERLSDHDGPLVIFGHSLGVGDDHLIQAIRRWKRRRIAISVQQADEARLNEVTASYESRLPEANIVFFDAATHPLGDPKLDMRDAPFQSQRSRVGA